jgi:hypothetical protein
VLLFIPGLLYTLRSSDYTVLNSWITNNVLRFEVFTAITMKNVVFWDVAPCRYFFNQRFGGTYRLHLQGRRNPRAMNQREQVAVDVKKISTQHHIPEDCILNNDLLESIWNEVVMVQFKMPSQHSSGETEKNSWHTDKHTHLHSVFFHNWSAILWEVMPSKRC